MDKLISIIIPVYNGEHFLERCLRSVIAQTYKNLEIIVVNDGSTDRSAEKINRFVEIDKRIIPIHQQNKGVSAARNAGLKKATGDFIGFVDGDDEVLPDMYEFLLNNAINYDADISHCGFELVKKDSTINFHNTGVMMTHNKFQGVAEILSGQRVEPSPCNKLFKKEVIANVSFPEDIKNNEDLLFNVEAFYHANTSVFQDVVKYKYIHNSESASRTSFTVEKANDIYQVAKRIKFLLNDEPLKENVERFYAFKMLTLLQVMHQNRLRKSEIANIIRTEVSKIQTRKMGFRIHFTKVLLMTFPFLYGASRFIYDLFFSKNQKWKNH
jgi:Glycosyltransferases involved in cell wall biogenesis